MKQDAGQFRSSRPSQRRSGSGSAQRWALLIGGGALAIFGLARRSKTGKAMAAAGTLVSFRNAKAGRTAPYTAHASFAINCSPEEAYQFWRNLENLPRFMRHLESVRALEDGRSEWTALGPGEKKIQWTAEITEDQPGRRIAWRSLPGSEFENSGAVEFRPGTAGRGTVVTATMNYAPPAGAAGRALATVMGKSPEFTVREDLRRFKALIEAGEAPTTEGQSHGPRGLHGKAERVLFREPQNQPEPQNAALSA